MEYEQDHPSFNIILDRGDKVYHKEGRWQTEEEARELDIQIEELTLNFFSDRTIKIPYNDKKAILETALQKIDI